MIYLSINIGGKEMKEFMTKEDFISTVRKLGYANQSEAEKYISLFPKEEYDESDIENVYRLCILIKDDIIQKRRNQLKL
jgi:hypothetical protein